MKKLLKSFPSALSLGIALSGGIASAQVVEIAGRAIPSAGAGSAAAVSAAPPMALPLTALSPSFAAPSAFAPSPAAPAAPSAAGALSALPAASVPDGPAAGPAPVAEYRRLRDEYQESKRSFNDIAFRVHEGGSIPQDALKAAQERVARKAALDAFVAAHPGVKYAAAGTLGRAWLAMTGRFFDGAAAHEGAAPAAVAEYRSLRGEYKNVNRRLSRLYSAAATHEPGLPSNETLRDMHETAQKRGVQKAKLDAFVAANPGVDYAAAGTLGRAWLAMTGRAPASAAGTEVSEYKELRDELKALTRRLNGLLFAAHAAGPDLPPPAQTFQDVNKALRQHEAQKAKLDAFVAAHPGVPYAAAGTLGRAWLALTGRAL